MTSFTLPRLERVIAGPGTLTTIPSELDRYGCRRALIVTGATVGASPLVTRVRLLLAERCAGVFTGARQHVPSSTVQALVQVVRDAGADLLVSVGGGSPIDTAKAAVHALLDKKRTTETQRLREEESLCLRDSVVRGASDGLIHIAVPTTLSAGEFTDVAGVTDEATRIKHALFDTRLAARTVVADPEATLDTPAWLWAASGVRALDHAIETLYSNRRHPISEPLAERALRMLFEHLPPSLVAGTGDALDHRGQCQMAAWLAVFGVTNAGFGLSHVLGHQIGPRWNVAHGVTSSIVLPHAMRFMAEVVPDRFAAIARGVGVSFDPASPQPGALACADRTASFIASLGLPVRLRDVAVPPDRVRDVAAVVADLMARAQVVPHPVGRGDLEGILAAAY